jgi:ferredoxin
MTRLGRSMLWTAMEKTEDSRLGCQIVVRLAQSHLLHSPLLG